MLSECEEKVAALQTTLDEREEELEAVVGDKQAKIISLEASLQFLQVHILGPKVKFKSVKSIATGMDVSIFRQASLVAKDEELNKKEEIVKKLRSMIDLYTPPQDRLLRWSQQETCNNQIVELSLQAKENC